jgi:predicted  nucleic acid-binding Zn-ribbon protein
MPENIKALEAELQELVKRSRTLSVEMSQISERMLALSAEIARLQSEKRSGDPLEPQKR